MGGWDWDGGADDPRSIREAENGLRQIRRLVDLIRQGVSQPPTFTLTVEILCDLNRLAVDGLVSQPGILRDRDLEIRGSRHEPPHWQDVPALVVEMLDYLNGLPLGRDPMHAAAYVLWRLNWIHPFEDGNGRTARAAAYLVLSVGIGMELPGDVTLLERLTQKKFDYQDGLEDSDKAWAAGRLDVTMLSELLHKLLNQQLADAGYIW